MAKQKKKEVEMITCKVRDGQRNIRGMAAGDVVTISTDTLTANPSIFMKWGEEEKAAAEKRQAALAAGTAELDKLKKAHSEEVKGKDSKIATLEAENEALKKALQEAKNPA